MDLETTDITKESGYVIVNKQWKIVSTFCRHKGDAWYNLYLAMLDEDTSSFNTFIKHCEQRRFKAIKVIRTTTIFIEREH